MEPLIAIVGFLGAGKTTLLKKLVSETVHSFRSPAVILNDYQNAQMDAQYFQEQISSRYISAISGSCVCCTGVTELRREINNIPKREQGITFIEANGTTDACTLMGFLGVGIKAQFLPPVQIAVIDARHWQKRGHGNELEANQAQVSSLIVINHHDAVDTARQNEVTKHLSEINPEATICLWEALDSTVLPLLRPTNHKFEKMDHLKSHWSSCSVDLPDNMPLSSVKKLLNRLPKNILRIKGCTRLDGADNYSFFERIPSGEIFIRPFYGKLLSGTKLLMIGPGSDPQRAQDLLKEKLQPLNPPQ